MVQRRKHRNVFLNEDEQVSQLLPVGNHGSDCHIMQCPTFPTLSFSNYHIGVVHEYQILHGLSPVLRKCYSKNVLRNQQPTYNDYMLFMVWLMLVTNNAWIWTCHDHPAFNFAEWSQKRLKFAWNFPRLGQPSNPAFREGTSLAVVEFMYGHIFVICIIMYTRYIKHFQRLLSTNSSKWLMNHQIRHEDTIHHQHMPST